MKYVCPLVAFHVFSRYFACGSLYLVLSDTFHLSAATVCRCVAQVTGALIKIAHQHIQMPSVEALPDVKARFYAITSTKKRANHFLNIY